MTRKIQEEIKSYRALMVSDLLKMLLEKEDQLIRLKRQLLFGKISNHRDLKKIKKDIARIQTIISEKAEEEIIKDKTYEKNK